VRFDIVEIEKFLRNKERNNKDNPYKHILAPEISKEKMYEIVESVKILHCDSYENAMCEIKVPHDFSNISYTWSPTFVCKAPNLKKIRDIFTFHSYGYYGFFKPSLEEVLRQLQYEDLTHVYGFSISGPNTAEDLNEFIGLLNEGYHVARVTLWALA